MKTYLCFLLLGACGQQGFDYETAQGMRIYSFEGYPSVEQVESSCAATIAAMGGRGYKALEYVKVIAENHPIDVPSVGLTNGVYLKNLDEIGINITDQCWARTAFVHELIHMYQWKRDQISDNLHTDPYWWGYTGIEAKAQNLAISFECPEKGPEWIDPETQQPIGGW